MPVILQINSSANFGSTGRITEQLGKMMIERGWDSYIAYGRYMTPSSSKLIKVGSDKVSQAVHLFLSKFFDAHGLGSVMATKRFVNTIKKIKPDIVHLHNIHGYYLNYRILFQYLNSAEIPIVWTFHDCWSFTGHCAHFVNIGCKKWKTGCSRCPLKSEYPSSLLMDCSKNNYEKKRRLFTASKNIQIVTVSEWLASLVKESFFKGFPISVIGNGVDLQVFKPLIADSENEFIVLALAGVWSEEKGLLDFVRLSLLLKDQARLVMIGVSERQRRGLPDRITCVPHTDSMEELVKWYNRAGVVVSLSKAETFGLTIAEGMACGTPAIVYDNTAQPELLTKETGFVVKDGDVEGVYSKIMEIKKIGKSHYMKACRKRAEERFGHQDRYKEYLSLYMSIVK